MLNGTFLVQAIHFFIAYLILERFLFRPAIHQINEDKLEQKHLKESMHIQATIVKNLEQEQQEALASLRTQVKEMMPSLKTVVVSIPQELPTVPVLAPEEKTKIIDTCASSLLNEVEHVR